MAPPHKKMVEESSEDEQEQKLVPKAKGKKAKPKAKAKAGKAKPKAKPKPKSKKAEKKKDPEPSVEDLEDEESEGEEAPSVSAVAGAVCKAGSTCEAYPIRPFDPAKQLKFVSYNVNGFRAAIKKGNFLKDLAERENPDVIGLQEIKCQDDSFKILDVLPGYDLTMFPSVDKLGYAGTAVYVRKALKGKVVKGFPNAKPFNGEGRVLSVEIGNVVLVNTYVPNAGQKLERLNYRVKEWDKTMFGYLKQLEEDGKQVIWTGDLNCAQLDIDVYNAKTQKGAGFTPQERKSFGTFVGSKETGFFDSFRALYPKAIQYTYWSVRGNLKPANKGWRLDYFILSQDLRKRLVDSYVLEKYNASDHCPIACIITK